MTPDAPAPRSLRRSLKLLAVAVLLASPGRTHPAPQAADWRPVQVPGLRKAAEAPGADGIAWYRAWVKVDDSFFTKHERNLFEESVGVNLRDLAGTHDIWVNGCRPGRG